MISQSLITGATGFIGQRLLQAGDRALVRSDGCLRNAVVGDLLEPASLIAACQGVATIFHCAGYAHAFRPTDQDMHWRINFEGTKNLVEAAVRAGVKRFVFLSTVAAMGEQKLIDEPVDEDSLGIVRDAYGVSKRASEEYIKEASEKFGLEFVIIRPPLVYGRGDPGNMARMVRGLRAGWFPRLPETGNKRSLVHVDDVVSAMRLVAQRPEANGRTYIVADSVAHSGREICEAILAVQPVPKFSWSVPAWMLRMGGRLGDLVQKHTGRPLQVNSKVVSNLLDSAWYSSARIERELGWQANIGLSEGIREMLGSETSV